MRISINAIYDRIYKEIGYTHVGLLHSSALDYLEENYEFENTELLYEQSKTLYMKLTVCTIDQIFPFVFKYKGYEKIYATFSYSKIIIDEIQAYSPEIVAIIIKGIEMIQKIGGKILIMTATLPRIYKDKLKELHINFNEKAFPSPILRHRIKMQNEEISDNLGYIVDLAQKSKVLIIVNTINKSIELYEKLKQQGFENANLLHSRFIANDRKEKEAEILKFSGDKNSSGIWITTQIVEASLDIDFDYLFTEMSTLDSLFQRMGRCYRKREYSQKEPNVYIFYKNTSGIGKNNVYDKDIYEKSIDLLNHYNGNLLKEEEKAAMVDELYSKKSLEGTSFLKNFEDAMDYLNTIVDFDSTKKEAQKLLRNIDNLTVIPKTVYEKNANLFEKYSSARNFTEKNKIYKEILKLTTTISKGQARKFSSKISAIPCLNEKAKIELINLKYSNETGLILKNDEKYDLDDRFC